MAKVFIVEDSKIQALLLEKILVKEGHKVRTFKNGNRLIEVLEEEIPNLIISDIEMPVLSGFELIESLRQKSYRKIPFFFVSSRGDDDTIQKARTLGADFFLTKPFSTEKLLTTARRILN